MTTARNDGVLRPDFARRVVERVRRAKRRRQLYRWALTSAFACALVSAAIFSTPIRNLSRQPSTLLAQRNDSHSQWVVSPQELGGLSQFDLPSFGRPLAFFFPGSAVVADFQSSEATYWHSYDPWWNTGTLSSWAGNRSELE